MTDLAETLFKFKVVQLEGKLAIYESLITEIVKLESMETAVSDVKIKLERVTAAWNKKQKVEKNSG